METLRTIFSKLSKNDYTDLYKLHSNSEVRKYLGGTKNENEFKKQFDSFFSAELPEIYWVVREKDTNNFIGVSSISKYHDDINYEVSYELLPEYWNDGFGTEIVSKTVDYAFKELGLQTLYAETQKKNIASRKVLEKIGMQFLKEIERFNEKQVIYRQENKQIV
jgi:ribosomal-protein-alanine N-acetyltransferase